MLLDKYGQVSNVLFCMQCCKQYYLVLHVRLALYCCIWSCVDSRAQYGTSFSAVVLLDVVLYVYI